MCLEKWCHEIIEPELEDTQCGFSMVRILRTKPESLKTIGGSSRAGNTHEKAAQSQRSTKNKVA